VQNIGLLVVVTIFYEKFSIFLSNLPDKVFIIKILVMAAFPLACPQKHKIRNNNNKNNEKNVCP
jgi:hypothetical protein